MVTSTTSRLQAIIATKPYAGGDSDGDVYNFQTSGPHCYKASLRRRPAMVTSTTSRLQAIIATKPYTGGNPAMVASTTSRLQALIATKPHSEGDQPGLSIRQLLDSLWCNVTLVDGARHDVPDVFIQIQVWGTGGPVHSFNAFILQELLTHSSHMSLALSCIRRNPGQQHQHMVSQGGKAGFVPAGSHQARDSARLPLFKFVNEEKLKSIKTFAAFISLLDNYEMSTGVAEVVTSEEIAEMNRFLDAILETKVMKVTHEYLVRKKWSKPNVKDFKSQLYNIWFQLYSREPGKG
ncbi:unnamed protein product [Ranitomeya imitator]|uniref:Protein endoU n=1 Tax=Ranitomeya imitator TaxID=111125 RepID=A0ABN9M122_9NEOB|nr:unnamed protein product [Ranitomeya imitator]